MTINASTGAPYSRIVGVGGYRGSRVVDNTEMCTIIDSSDEWIRQRTGIAERRWATDEETPLSMAEAAGRSALEHAGMDASEIDVVLVATVSHTRHTPSLANYVANELGMGHAAAMDLSAACAGFCYGLTIADSLVRSGAGHHVLVIGVEKLSLITDFTDRGTAFLFADGAGAAVVGPSDTPGVGPVEWGSLPDTTDWIYTEDWRDLGDADTPTIEMQGHKVFKWAISDVAATCQRALDRSGLTHETLDCLIPHQANDRIIEALVRHLHLPDTIQVSHDVRHMGNCSAASIPLAISAMLEDGTARSGQSALICGFGAGMVYAAQVIVLP